MATSKLTPEQEQMLDVMADMPDDQIDTMDIPEARTWSGAVRGARYRPVKQQLTLRIDADLIDWFKRHAPSGKYQTDINRALRDHVEREKARQRKVG